MRRRVLYISGVHCNVVLNLGSMRDRCIGLRLRLRLRLNTDITALRYLFYQRVI